MTACRARLVVRTVARLAHLYQCGKCGGWTEFQTCPVCPPS